MKRGWLTKDSLPANRVDYVINLPDNELWRADFLGALLLLCQAENWEQFEALTPQEMADEWLEVLLEFEQFGGFMIPVGTILAFGGDAAPSGFLLCNGATFSRSDFARLFDVIGVAFGVGNGTTTANLPDLRGRVGVGYDASQTEFDVLGESGGAKTHTLTTSQLASHTHTQNAHTHTQNAHTHTQNEHDHIMWGALNANAGTNRRQLNIGSGTDNSITQGTIATNQNATPTNQNATPTNQSTGSDASHNNLQPYLAVNYIIKF